LKKSQQEFLHRFCEKVAGKKANCRAREVGNTKQSQSCAIASFGAKFLPDANLMLSLAPPLLEKNEHEKRRALLLAVFVRLLGF
jgi:hypothetical protein